ncbi:uncharacterized protein BJ171DRAFT_548948 [Polychytrium aggregatum]|uniref:uncharacterized protein n=1 Tax=Polychytrium aggregatum TaxID=110093 RepID=UPI0022FF26EC|nr:uncharacterized protein BJ171DRAFT_548948 [Polychytrium aggregatum]KAI9188578.1 hypothetical protein BJ171DRAFT_548948 [Polychytrium aggregatum]
MVGWMHYLGRGTLMDQRKGIQIIRDNETRNRFRLGEDVCLCARQANRSATAASVRFFGLCRLGSRSDWLCRHLMAVCLYQAFGTPRSMNTARYIFGTLARDGHSDSQVWFWSTKGFYSNINLHLHHLQASAAQGNQFAQLLLGEYQSSNDRGAAFGWFTASALQGNRRAQYHLGRMYQGGLGVPRDINMAVEWYQLSATQNCSLAQYELGICFLKGLGVARNRSTANELLHAAAKQGDTEAMAELRKIGGIRGHTPEPIF